MALYLTHAYESKCCQALPTGANRLPRTFTTGRGYHLRGPPVGPLPFRGTAAAAEGVVEPDLGTAVVVGGIGFVVLFASGLPLRWVAGAGAAAAASAGVALDTLKRWRSNVLTREDPAAAHRELVAAYEAFGAAA